MTVHTCHALMDELSAGYVLVAASFTSQLLLLALLGLCYRVSAVCVKCDV